MTVSNSTFTLANPGFELKISDDIVIGPQGTLGIGDLYTVTSNYWLQCGGGLTVQNSGVLELYGVLATVPSGSPDAQLEVAGAVRVEDGGQITIASDRWLGGTPLLRMREITIATNGVISADNLGFKGGDRFQNAGYGPGGGLRGGLQSGGGGYGGRGGNCSGSGDHRGYPYGLANAPLLPGSGSGAGESGYGAYGGGLIHLEVERDFVLQGTLRACGENGASKTGGGSGGGIFIKCRAFNSTPSAVLRVDGGIGQRLSGGGGGGRIAIWEDLMRLDPALLEQLALGEPTPGYLKINMDFTAIEATVSADGGAISANGTEIGSDGTFAYIRIYYESTVIIVR